MKVLAISNKIQIVNTNSSETKVVSFGDDKYVFGIDYSLNPTFLQQFRLDLKLWKRRPLESGKSYRGSNGEYQNNNVIIDKQIDIQTGYMDDDTHFALSVATKHKYLYIDNKRYFRNSDYEIDHNDESGDILQLAIAKATLIEQSKGLTNQTC